MSNVIDYSNYREMKHEERSQHAYAIKIWTINPFIVSYFYWISGLYSSIVP